ncbi:MAG: stage III sporulation protein AB [Eubacteriales bacterium]|nr:stage III sporulation protein AB [Eubacteriales bacterium]
MIYKIIGGAIFLFSSIAFGMAGAMRIKKSLSQTEDLRNGLQYIKNDIHLRNSSIGNSIINSSCVMVTELSKVFLAWGQAINSRNGNSPKDVIAGLLYEDYILLSTECKELILSWASQFGGGDKTTEGKEIEHIITQVDCIIEKQKDESDTKIKLYKTYGFMIGAIVLVVIL